MKEAKNNSYESEPSSMSSVGSGHSLSSANNDYLQMVEVANINLPLLLEPRAYVYEEEVAVAKVEASCKVQNSIESCKDRSACSSAYRSSQESPFAGFRETPLKDLQAKKFIYEDTTDVESQANEDCDDDVVYVQTIPVFTEAPKKVIYDTIVSENSCNAVDMPLATDEQLQESNEKDNSTVLTSQVSDLSFNGKIKALDLNCSQDEIKTTQNKETLYEANALDLNASSFFQCGMSPDLFADDDEDDDDGEDHTSENNNIKDTKLEVLVENFKENVKRNAPHKHEQMDSSANHSLNCTNESSFAEEPTLDYSMKSENSAYKLYRENCKRERMLLRRIRQCLSGVPPPPSLTLPQMDLMQLVLDRKEDILQFCKNSNVISNKLSERTSLFKPTHSLIEAKTMPWRDVLGVRQHGLCYNLTTASEHCEYLSLSVVERFVGAETTSSYRRSPSSAKKRNLREKLLPQSPGNRLSHLAKRRAIFSSANLATTSLRSATALGPQIAIDKKKSKNRRKATPKRKTPGSKKKTRKTPSSSARKLQYRSDFSKVVPSRETSKRALFQSPMDIQQQQFRSSIPQIKPEIATKVERSKRALFSPETTTSRLQEQEQIQKPTTSAAVRVIEPLPLKRKRNENDNDDDDASMEGLCMPSKKLLRCDASNLTPRALKIKSQSFCIGAGSSDALDININTKMSKELKSAKRNLLGTSGSNNSFQSLSSAGSNSSLNLFNYGVSTSSLLNEKKLQRAQSDMTATSTSLTENQKKKLLWAVSQALQEKKITTKHENFKQFASVLARVVRRIFQEFYQGASSSNSETLLRLAKKYVFYVITGRSCDDIYTQVRSEEHKRLSTSRLSGYIGPEEYQQRKQQQQQLSQFSQSSLISSFQSSNYGSMQNLLSVDSMCSQLPPDSNQSTTEATANQTKYNFGSSVNYKRSSIEVNANQRNSSSKSNLGSLALRENSGQKNFTGKDQRNVSPYAKANSGLKISSNNLSLVDTNASAKAKRQILFDS